LYGLGKPPLLETSKNHSAAFHTVAKEQPQCSCFPSNPSYTEICTSEGPFVYSFVASCWFRYYLDKILSTISSSPQTANPQISSRDAGALKSFNSGVSLLSHCKSNQNAYEHYRHSRFIGNNPLAELEGSVLDCCLRLCCSVISIHIPTITAGLS
jgi:hypothetical protein